MTADQRARKVFESDRFQTVFDMAVKSESSLSDRLDTALELAERRRIIDSKDHELANRLRAMMIKVLI